MFVKRVFGVKDQQLGSLFEPGGSRMDQDNRWWPAESDAQLVSYARELIGNLLGPNLNRELACLLDDAKDKGIVLSPELDELRQSLWDCDGQAPVMLVNLYAGVVLAHRYSVMLDERQGPDDGLPEGGNEVINHSEGIRWDFLKTVGWVAELATEKYGFTRDSWREFFLIAGSGREPQWPPKGVGYRRYL